MMPLKTPSLPVALWRFICAVVKHWVSLMTGGILVFALVLYERTTGANVPLSFYWAIAAFTVVAATFLAWWDEYLGRERAEKQLDDDARAPQRAYVSALPGGVDTTTRGELLAHVEFRNVGHLPASQVKSILKFTASDDGEWSPPPVDDKDLRPAGVLPIGVSVTTGTHGIGVPQPWTRYLYAWGRVTYVDGFDEERWTNFCHRYNTEVRQGKLGGGSLIPKETGRHHERGNDAN